MDLPPIPDGWAIHDIAAISWSESTLTQRGQPTRYRADLSAWSRDELVVVRVTGQGETPAEAVGLAARFASGIPLG